MTDSRRLHCSSPRLRAGLYCLCAMLAASGPGGCRTGDYESIGGSTMGTYYAVTARCPASLSSARVQAVLDEVDTQMSTYDPESAVSRFNRAAPGEWVSVPASVVVVVAAALRLSEQSQGRFDVTVGPSVAVWGFGPAGPLAAPPAQEAVRAAQRKIGYRHLHVDPRRNALRKETDLEIDLSAIAKGYAADRLGARLGDLGCRDFLIDIGGEVLGRGVNRHGDDWVVGVQAPDAEFGVVDRTLQLRNMAVATSGDYRNYVERDGERLSHTIDPRTGAPVRHHLASVTVVHESAMWADGLATTINVLGPEEGLDFAEQRDVAALLMVRTAAGFEVLMSTRMAPYLTGR